MLALAPLAFSGLLACTAYAASLPFGAHLKNVVTFGDSYTDSTNFIVTGGTTWPEYLASYADLHLFPFAISGATCNNDSTPRLLFPDVLHDELGAFFNTTKKNKTKLVPEETLYTLWIGTNDVGAGELITGQQTPGISIVDVARCQLQVIETLYQSGARNFLLQNMLPLDQVPLYAADSYPDKYWTGQRNTTEWNVFMKELVAAHNELSRLMVQTTISKLKGATIGVFDSHALFSEMLAHPSLYLNGTAPLNTTGAVSSCVFALDESTSDPGACTIANGTARDSFVWFDELHPSEQADRIVAREIARTLNGTTTRWIETFKG